ncbi:hypothetical protein [Rathayibacter sp. AY1B1]|nr:hypothetical protein [Rathayibacter sp. AY1B1]
MANAIEAVKASTVTGIRAQERRTGVWCGTAGRPLVRFAGVWATEV